MPHVTTLVTPTFAPNLEQIRPWEASVEMGEIISIYLSSITANTKTVM